MGFDESQNIIKVLYGKVEAGVKEADLSRFRKQFWQQLRKQEQRRINLQLLKS